MSEKKRFKLGSIEELRFAMKLAREAHESIAHIRVIGFDIGKPYFDTHVVRVIKQCPVWAKPAAALHDVEEDCGHFWRTQFQLQVSEETDEALKLLTRDPDETYDEYIERILKGQGMAGRIARIVKFNDLIDNLQTLPTGSLRERYIQALGRIASDISMNGEGAWDE